MNTNRKDGEINALNTKLEGEQNLVAQLQKKIKELQVCAIVNNSVTDTQIEDSNDVKQTM